MRIAVFGGTGVTGRLLIAQALDEGDSVTAYARHPEKLAIVNDRLTVVEGELSDAAAIERAVEGADGVISLLGQGRPDRQPSAAFRGQKRARSHGNAGIPGIPGNVVSVTYRIQRMAERPNPTLSAKFK